MLNYRPFLKTIKGKKEDTNVTLGDGDNTYGTPFSISSTESRESRNLCGDEYPAMAVRKGRGIYVPVSGSSVFHSIGQRNSEDIHYQRGTTWSYWDSSTKQKDTITLSGSSGTASITVAGGLTKTVTFSGNLTTTATNFKTANAAAYLAQGITLTSSTNTLIFESVTAGEYFDNPIITNATGDLAGTVANTVTNETSVKTSLTAASGKIEEFNTGTTKYTLLFNGTDRYSWDGATPVSLTNAPLTNKFTVHKGRVYALLGSQLKFSALNLLNDWTTADDAGSISITSAKGDAVAIVEYNDYITVFTNYSMHQLYGTGPDNYELKDVPGNIGCISDKSVVVCKGILYWMWYDGLYTFTGGVPRKASYKGDAYFNGMKGNESYFENISCGTQGDLIYISIPYGTGQTTNNLILKYDTERDKWYPDSSVQYTGFTSVGNTLYGIEATAKNVCKVNLSTATADSTGAITWYWNSGPRLSGAVWKNKTLSELWMIYDLPLASTLSVYTSKTADQDDWVLIETSTGTETKIVRGRIKIPIDTVAGVEFYRIRITGTGPCTVHYFTERYRVK